MPLVVEDGSGLPDAESYVSVADFDAHCAAWGYDIAGRTAAQKEAALRQATVFIDTLGRYRSRRLSPAQALEFPREDLTEWGGHPAPGVPPRVRRACAELAFKALSAPLKPDVARGGRVLSESVGPISVTFADDAPVGTTWRLAEDLLEPFLRRDATDLRGPAWEGPLAPAFPFGLHDHPGT